MRDQLTAAIEQRKIVTFTYDGLARRVQPAAYGIGNRKGKDTLHAYQIGGESQRGGIPHWRNFHVEKMSSVTVLDEVFGPNPPGLRPNPFPTTLVSLAGSPSTAASAPSGSSGSSGGSGGGKPDQVIPGVPISAEQAQKAAEVAGKAFGMIGKWLKKR